MENPPTFARVYVKEARPCFIEMTRGDLRPVFQRLTEDPDFRAIQTFRGQVVFAKNFIEEEAQLEKDLPNTELARFFDVTHDQSIRAILKAKDAKATFMGRRSTLSDEDYEDITLWIDEAIANKKPLTLNDIVARLLD